MRKGDGLWIGAALVLGGAVGAMLYYVAIFAGIAIGWLIIFGDGNGREDWFMPLLDFAARIPAALCVPLAYWLLAPTHPLKRRTALLMGGIGLLAALLLIPWGLDL